MVAQVCFYYRLWPAISWAKQLVDVGRARAGAPLPRLDAAGLRRRPRPRSRLAGPARRVGRRRARRPRLAHHRHRPTPVRRDHGGVGDHPRAGRPGACRRRASTTSCRCSSTSTRARGTSAACVEASWALRGHKCDLGFDLVCERGALRFSWERFNEIGVLTGDVDDPMNGYRSVLIGGGQPDVGRFVAVPGQGMGYRDAFTVGVSRTLAAIARGERIASPSFEDGLQVALTVEAAKQSAAERRWVDVPSARLAAGGAVTTVDIPFPFRCELGEGPALGRRHRDVAARRHQRRRGAPGRPGQRRARGAPGGAVREPGGADRRQRRRRVRGEGRRAAAGRQTVRSARATWSRPAGPATASTTARPTLRAGCGAGRCRSHGSPDSRRSTASTNAGCTSRSTASRSRTVSTGTSTADGCTTSTPPSAASTCSTYDVATGDIADRRPFAELDIDGIPDGMTIDADGCVWVAVFGGGQVRRYDPDGALMTTVALPVQHPTSIAFGGRRPRDDVRHHVAPQAVRRRARRTARCGRRAGGRRRRRGPTRRGAERGRRRGDRGLADERGPGRRPDRPERLALPWDGSTATSRW